MRALIRKVCVCVGGGGVQDGRRGAVKVFAHVRVQHEKLMDQGDEDWGKMKILAKCTTLPKDMCTCSSVYVFMNFRWAILIWSYFQCHPINQLLSARDTSY